MHFQAAVLTVISSSSVPAAGPVRRLAFLPGTKQLPCPRHALGSVWPALATEEKEEVSWSKCTGLCD